MKTISSRQNPIVREFRDLARAPDPGARLLLDGAHLVREAQRAGAAIRIVAVAASKMERDSEEGALARALAGSGTEVVSASDQVFDAMSPVRTPGGIVAIAERTPATACRHLPERRFRPRRDRRPGSGQSRVADSRGGSRRRHRRRRDRRVGASVFLEGGAREHGQRAAPADRIGPVGQRGAVQHEGIRAAHGGAVPRGGVDPLTSAGAARSGCCSAAKVRGSARGHRRERRARHHPDGVTGRVAQRRRRRRDPRIRRAAATSMSGSLFETMLAEPLERRTLRSAHGAGRRHPARRADAAAYARRGRRPGRNPRARGSHYAKRSSAISCSRSSSGDHPAPARRRWRASSPT